MPHRLLISALPQKGTIQNRNQNKSQSELVGKVEKTEKIRKIRKNICQIFQNVFDDSNWSYCMQ